MKSKYLDKMSTLQFPECKTYFIKLKDEKGIYKNNVFCYMCIIIFNNRFILIMHL